MEALGIKIKYFQLVGMIFLVSFLLLGVYAVIDYYVPDRYDMKTEVAITTAGDALKITEERYKRLDSIYTYSNKMWFDSLRYYSIKQRGYDSALNYFYNFNTIQYNEKINHINNATHDELLREWTTRFGR